MLISAVIPLIVGSPASDRARVRLKADATPVVTPATAVSGFSRTTKFIKLMPIFGLGQQKPHHFLEMAKVAWENRDELPFAWRILKDGVCDGCALGTSGMSDWTIPGTHLCMVRLELMRLNTAPRPRPLDSCRRPRLAKHSSQDLRALGRLPEPMIRRKTDAVSPGSSGTMRSIGSLGSFGTSIRFVSPFISRRAGLPTKCITPRRRRRGFSARIMSIIPRVFVMRRQPRP